MLSRRHAHVSKTSLYSTIWAPPHERVHNGLVPAPRPLTVLIPLVPTRRKVLGMSKTFAGSRRVSPAANGPPTCSPIAQRPAVCPHRVPPLCSCRMAPAKPTVCHRVVNFVRTVEHGEGTRRGVDRSVNMSVAR